MSYSCSYAVEQKRRDLYIRCSKSVLNLRQYLFRIRREWRKGGTINQHQHINQSPLSGREGRAGRLVPPSLPAPDTLFPHKEHKIGFPVITCSPSQHGGSQGVDISSPELPREVPRFFRRGGFKGRFSKLPALPYISSRQLKCVATPRTRGGRASIKERAVLRK